MAAYVAGHADAAALVAHGFSTGPYSSYDGGSGAIGAAAASSLFHAGCFGPMTIESGYTVTVSTGATFTVV